MEPINFIKGYNKVENPNPSPNNRRKFITITISIFLAILVTLAIAALINKSTTKSQPSVQSSNNYSLRTICSVTRYPNSCFSSISPLNTPQINDPLRFFNLSLHVSTIEVKNLSGSYSEPALKDCAELLDDSVSQLVKSAELMRVGPVLTEMKVSDMKTWISAALTDQETCVDGLEEMGLKGVDEFKARVQRSQEYVSNTLAILNNMGSLYDKFGLKMP